MMRGCGLLALFCSSLWMLQPAVAAESKDDPARKLLAQLVAHDFAAVRAHLTPQMAAALPSDGAFAAIWQQFTDALGTFQRVDAAEAVPVPGMSATLLHCTFDKGPLNVLLVVDGQGRLAGLRFPPPQQQQSHAPNVWLPPPYSAPDRVEERDVVVGKAPLALPGKLTMPRGKGPFAAVVLVHGSGAQDENETLGPNQPFHDLALGLAARGIAVLRYRKRLLVYPRSFAGHNLTVREETTDDAEAAVALLATTAKIDRKRIFVIGHSLGAMLAPRIAAHDPLVAGIVIMAGPTRPLEELLVEQLTARGTPAQVAAAKASLAHIRDPKLKPDDDVELVGAHIPGSYFLDLRGYAPAQVAAKLDVPILVLQGDRDIQVRPVDFAGWQATLASRPRAKLVHYAKLTHLFAEGEGTLADYHKPSHVAPEVIDDIATFVDNGRAK